MPVATLIYFTAHIYDMVNRRNINCSIEVAYYCSISILCPLTKCWRDIHLFHNMSAMLEFWIVKAVLQFSILGYTLLSASILIEVESSKYGPKKTDFHLPSPYGNCHHIRYSEKYSS